VNPAYLPAVAALLGSAIGGLTSFASAWLTQRHQDRARRLSQTKARRQKLYKQFIDEASKLYADALVHDNMEVSVLVSSYALISQMHVLSTSAVVEKAEAVVHMIVHTYCSPNKTVPELRELISSRTIDPLRAFSKECRAELQAL
jgi:glycogen debranching enzyme